MKLLRVNNKLARCGSSLATDTNPGGCCGGGGGGTAPLCPCFDYVGDGAGTLCSIPADGSFSLTMDSTITAQERHETDGIVTYQCPEQTWVISESWIPPVGDGCVGQRVWTRNAPDSVGTIPWTMVANWDYRGLIAGQSSASQWWKNRSGTTGYGILRFDATILTHRSSTAFYGHEIVGHTPIQRILSGAVAPIGFLNVWGVEAPSSLLRTGTTDAYSIRTTTGTIDRVVSGCSLSIRVQTFWEVEIQTTDSGSGAVLFRRYTKGQTDTTLTARAKQCDDTGTPIGGGGGEGTGNRSPGPMDIIESL